jgi:CBS domain-containing protein
MKARDVMVSPVITVMPSCSVKEVAQTLLKNHISGVPVVDDQGRVVGIVSEGDLLRRAEAGTEQRRSWWLRGLVEYETLAAEYIKANSRKVAEVMVRDVIIADPDTPLDEIATLMEQKSIKRVPIVSEGQLVGIVSRANLVQAVASNNIGLESKQEDASIRERLMADLKAQPWVHTALLNVTVTGGLVHLWGITSSETEKQAISVAAENTAGVHAVYDHLVKGSHFGGA